MAKILVTGGNGQLSQALKAFQIADFDFCTRDEMDICSPDTIQKMIDLYQPNIIINTAAYTAVDKAEQEKELALAINHQGTENLSIICNRNNIILIHISTDYVFDGKSKQAYQEIDDTNPINTYGYSKLLGEYAVREYCPNHIILRVSGVFSNYGNNFYKTMRRMALERTNLSVVNDQITCPTHAYDIAQAIIIIVNNLNNFGTYHFCSAPPVSWYGFTNAIIDNMETKKVTHITPIASAEYPTLAKRPLYSVLDCSKINNDYRITQPSWETRLREIA